MKRRMVVDQRPQWVTRGKSIAQLVKELATFDNHDLEVKLSLDGGETLHPISLVGHHQGQCVLLCYANERQGEY